MNRGRNNRRKWGLRLVILLLTLGFLMPAPTPVMALQTESGHRLHHPRACSPPPIIAYGVYENLPSRRGKERLLNGEFYAGGFLGGGIYSQPGPQLSERFYPQHG